MLRKFMFIGLGGSGGKTLRFLRSELDSWLNTVGWEGEFPVGWQMLHIDTPTKQDGHEVTDVPMLPAANYLGLVMDGVTFDTVATRVDTAGGNDGWEDLAGWRVDPTFLQVPITTGAGQFRAVGRTIGLAYADKVLKNLQACYQRLSTASAGAELAEIHQLAYGAQSPPPADPVVVVVSSLAGGTGSGLFMDVCDLLRQLPGEVGERSFGVLYASDVFHHLGTMSTAGVQPNSLAALSELMNGYWLTANYPRVSSVLAGAGAPAPIGRSGPAFPFLVGSSNTKGVSFGDQREVYAMMGKALKGWASDPTVQDRLVAYTMSNWQASAQGNAVKAEVLMADHLPIFEAFGFAEVSLGLDRLARYSRERLARDVAIWLIRGHHDRALQIDKDDNREPDQIADDLAREQLVAFLNQLQLNERGHDDQVIDALRPGEHEAQLRQAAALIESTLSQEQKALPGTVWTDRIQTHLTAHVDEHLRAMELRMRELLALWAEALPGRFIDAVLHTVSHHGMDTTIKLLDFVAEELLAVCTELADEEAEWRRWSEDPRSAVASKFTSRGNLPASNEQVSQAVWEGLWVAAHYQVEATVRALAQSALRDVANGLVRPIERALKTARHQLYEIGFEGDGVREPEVERWPDRSVPAHLEPPKNEFLVIDTDDFPDRYDELLKRSTRSEHGGPRHEVVRTDVITGEFLTEPRLHPVEVIQPWVPDLSARGIAAQPAQALQIRFRMTPVDLLRRAEAWIGRPGTAFERFLSEDLRSFLDDDLQVDPAELARRRANLRRSITAAFDAAEPLVRLDLGLFSLLHQRAEVPRRAVPSLVPFRDHPMESDVREILSGALGTDGQDVWESALTTARNIHSITISSTLGAAHDPLVFSSVMDPIVSGWNTAKQQSAARTNFWDNRRARPIEQFAPASHEVLLAMTRGWFTAVMLGRIDRERMQISRHGKVVDFPRMLLRDPSNERDRLPTLLESLGLAYAEVVNHKRLSFLEAYLELRDLGLSPGLPNQRAAGLYENPNVELAKWVRTGDLGEVIAKPTVELFAGSSLESASPQERRDAAIALLQRVLSEYSDTLQEYERRTREDRSLLGPNHPLWPGMWSLIERSLVDLKGVLSSMEIGDMDVIM